MSRRAPPLPLALPLLLLCACPPAADPAKPVDAAKQGEAAKPAEATKPAAPADAEAKPQPIRVAPGSAPTAAVGTGAQFRDPGWFRPTLFPGATMVKNGRSPADESGFFASQMTLQLAEGATREACEKTLTDAVAGDVAALAREDKDGRVTLTGDAAHYNVTLICGEAKGRMTAYVAYRWTSDPAAAAAP